MIEPTIGVNPVMPGWPGFVSANPYGTLSLVTAPTSEPITAAEVKAQLRLDTSGSEPAPLAPTVTLVASAGNVNAGSHRYAATFVTADGETECGLISSAVTISNPAVSGQVTVSDIALGGSAVSSRKLYRTAAGGSVFYLLATIADNTTTTYTDNIADASLGAQAPTTNSTQDPYLFGLIQAARMWCEAYCERAILSQRWALYLDSFPWWRAPIVVPKPPTSSVVSVQYFDTSQVQQTWDASNYIVMAPAGPWAQRTQIVPTAGVSWPLLPSYALTQRRPDQVTVTFITGWASAALVPPPIKQAMKLLIGNWYRNREAAALIRGSADVLPFGVEPLLAPYRVQVY